MLSFTSLDLDRAFGDSGFLDKKNSSVMSDLIDLVQASFLSFLHNFVSLSAHLPIAS